MALKSAISRLRRRVHTYATNPWALEPGQALLESGPLRASSAERIVAVLTQTDGVLSAEVVLENRAGYLRSYSVRALVREEVGADLEVVPCRELARAEEDAAVKVVRSSDLAS